MTADRLLASQNQLKAAQQLLVGSDATTEKDRPNLHAFAF
jgi:hypothetical protein